MEPRALRDRLEQAKRLGARGAEIRWEHRLVHEVAVSRGKVAEAPPEEVQEVVVTAWMEGGRAASASGPPGAADALVAQAVAQAGAAPLDEHAGPIARQTGVIGGLGVYDRRYEQVGSADRIEVVALAERTARADSRVATTNFVYRDQSRIRRLLNSRGVALEESDTTYEASGRVLVETMTGEITLRDHIASRTFASIASLPYGATLARRAADLLRPAVAVEGPIRALLPPLAVARLFAALADRFDARTIASLFLASPGVVLDPRVHLQDDGALPGGLRSASFDERGVAPVALNLLREGRLDGRLLDPELAHVHDVRPTGHTWGGRQRPSNLMLRTGTRSINATLLDLGGRTIVVDDLPDLGGLDFATGRFDLKVHAAALDGNRPVGAALNLRIRGDLRRVLGQLVELCSDTDRVGHVDAPGMFVDGIEAG